MTSFASQPFSSVILVSLSSLISFGWTTSLSNMPQSAISSIIPPRFYVNLTSLSLFISYSTFILVGQIPLLIFVNCHVGLPGDQEATQLHALLTLHELRHAQWPVTDTMKCRDWSEICYLRGVLWTEEQAAVCTLCSHADSIYHGNGNLNCVVGGNGVI